MQQLGSLCESQGRVDEAISYYEQYAAQFPEDAESYKSLAELYRSLGELERSRDYYQRMQQIEPQNITALVSLAGLEFSFGNFEAQLTQLNQALEMADTPRDRAEVFDALREAYANRGQLGRSIDQMELELQEMRHDQPAVLILMQQLAWLDTYIEAGRIDEAREINESVAAQLQPPFDMLQPMGRLSMSLALEEPDGVETALQGLEESIESFGVEFLRPFAQRPFSRKILFKNKKFTSDPQPKLVQEHRNAPLPARRTRVN